MTDLIPWLREQLDIDEKDVISGDCRCPDPGLSRADCPARVLAEVDAKRRILDAYDQTEFGDLTRRSALEEAITAFAVPYADRPGYRDEWRP
ncbi:MAG TPA: DUF6221 family protein [Pseudonocardia sp.]